MPPKTGDIIRSLIRLSYLLVSGSRSRSELCEMMHCSPSTISRDVVLLRDYFGMHIRIRREEGGAFYDVEDLGLLNARALIAWFTKPAAGEQEEN